MKYLYKQTGMIVESSEELDSMFFQPVKELAQQDKEETAPKKTTRKIIFYCIFLSTII